VVIGHDPFFEDEHLVSKELGSHKFFAAPRLDRIAAGLVDFSIVFLLSQVMAAKAIFALKISYNFDLDHSMFASIFNIIWLSFSVFLVYKVSTYRLLGRSLGQILFSIQTVSIGGYKKLDPYTIILRSLLTFLSLVLVFPLVSILINKDGRTFYDKICDTIVLTTRKNTARFNFLTPFDKLFGSVLVLSLFLGLSLFSLYLTKNTFVFKSDYEKNSKVCAQLTDFQNSWSKIGIQESRIEVALALYSATELSVECFNKEIDFELSINPQSSTAYFAKGLLSFDNDAALIQYFKKSCQLDIESNACLVATWISYWPNTIKDEKNITDFTNYPMFLKIWNIKRHHQKGNILKLAKALEELPVAKGLDGFYAENLMRVALYQEDSKDFENILKISESTEMRSRHLSETYCGTIASKSCEDFESLKLCNRLDINKSKDRHLLNMNSVCHGTEKGIFSSNESHEQFYRKLAKGEPQILDSLKVIFSNVNNTFPIRFATLTSFFKEVSNIEYLNSVKADWETDTSKDFIWRLTGENLKNKFKSLGDSQSSFQVYVYLLREYDEMKLNPENINILPEPLNRFPAQILSSEKVKLKPQVKPKIKLKGR
jgi:uncharacterized RDD family membrane protein YckC